MPIANWILGQVGGFLAKLTPAHRQDKALQLLEELDRCRELPAIIAIAAFFLSAATGVLAFFLILESALWAGMSLTDATLLVSISWVMIFPIWVLTFFAILSLLDLMGIKNLRAALWAGLSDSISDRNQLRTLQRALAGRCWRHGSLFRSVVADWSRERFPT